MRRVGLICTLVALSCAARAGDRPLVAVVCVDAALDSPRDALLDGLHKRLAAWLTAKGRARVVSWALVDEQLRGNRTLTYDTCYGRDCQLKIGARLGADQVLAARALEQGKACTLALVLYRLADGRAERAAFVQGGCERTGLEASLEAAAHKLFTASTDLASTALGHQSWRVRAAAVGLSEDQGVLTKVCKKDPVYQVRLEAARRLDDQANLGRLAASDSAWQVREAAAARLEDDGLLERLALKDPAWQVRRAAVGNLTDMVLLIDISGDDPSAQVRKAAKDRIPAVGPE